LNKVLKNVLLHAIAIHFFDGLDRRLAFTETRNAGLALDVLVSELKLVLNRFLWNLDV